MNGKDFQKHWELLKSVLIEKSKSDSLFYTNHALNRMVERNVTREEIKNLIDTCDPCEMFDTFRYPYGEKANSNETPVFTIKGHVNGRIIAIGLGIAPLKRDVKFTIITVITPKNGRYLND